MKHLLTPEMEITVTTKSYTCDPFYNGAKEIQEQYMRMYQFDYKKRRVVAAKQILSLSN